jgi:hypothetical protein
MQLNRDVLSIIIKYNDDYEDLLNLSKLNNLFKKVIYNMSSFEKQIHNFEEGNISINLSKKAKLKITNLNNFTKEENIMKLTNNIFYLKLHDLKYMNIINKCILLHTLDLSNTQVIDIAPLSKCVLLHTLYLSNTQVIDISPLSKCVSLHILYLYNTPVSQLSITQLKQINPLLKIELE